MCNDRKKYCSNDSPYRFSSHGFPPPGSQLLIVPSRQQVWRSRISKICHKILKRGNQLALNRESYAFDEISWPQHESIWGEDLIWRAWAGSCQGLLANRHWIRSSTKHSIFLIDPIKGLFFLLPRSLKSSIRMRCANSLSRRPWVQAFGTSLK